MVVANVNWDVVKQLELESKHYETSASTEITPSAETACPPTVKADKEEEQNSDEGEQEPEQPCRASVRVPQPPRPSDKVTEPPRPSVKVTEPPSPPVEVPRDSSHTDTVTDLPKEKGSVAGGTSTPESSPQSDQVVTSKRPSSEVAASSSSDEASFFLSKSTKTRGRPKIRKKQMQEVKRQRMDGAQKEAKQLVQGTLMPVFTLNDVTRVLKSSYSYESAYDFLKNVPVKEVGPRKQAIAREVNSSECMKSVQFVFTPEFSRKCSRAVEDFKKTTGQNKETTEKQAAVGVRVPKIGIFRDNQIAVMIDYYRAMDKLAVVAETVEWIKTTSLNRLHVPEGLDEFVNLDKTKAVTAIQRLVLPMSRQSPFGRIANESLLLFRKNLWLNDDSIMHAMTTLSEEMNELGVISPGFNATRDMSTTGNVIAGSEPFAKKNKFTLLPICIHGNHWCGAVFNFVDEPNSITLYDPQQRSEQFEECENIVQKIFQIKSASIEIKYETRLKQTDGVNCGPLVLLFFECAIRGIPLPTSLSKPLLRYLRLRFLMKSLHV